MKVIKKYHAKECEKNVDVFINFGWGSHVCSVANQFPNRRVVYFTNEEKTIQEGRPLCYICVNPSFNVKRYIYACTHGSAASRFLLGRLCTFKLYGARRIIATSS